MSTAYDSLLQIMDNNVSVVQKTASIRAFAKELDWTPSYDFHNSFGLGIAEDHLVVEHGLDTAAVISFIKSPNRASELSTEQLRTLLTISYNNLVDWHIFVSETDVRYINNRSQKYDQLRSLTRSNHHEILSSREVISTLTNLEINSLLPSCDDAFVNVISRWKRLLKAELPDLADNRSISALFNAIIFARGCEDSKISNGASKRAFLSKIDESNSDQIDLPRIIEEVLFEVGINQPLSHFVDASKLSVFTALEASTARDMLRDFYRPSNAPYALNFALLSKHALSRIYERYVAILEFDETEEQRNFLPPIPSEKSPDRTGSVYTPQFIAGFFTRYIQDNMTPRAFRTMKTIDPACGSGIFLRTILEHQCNPINFGVTVASITDAFATVKAVDRDTNACEATRLSLTLLYLVSTGMLPSELDVVNGDAISLLSDGQILRQSFDAVLANPPYIKLDHLTPTEKAVYNEYLGEKQGRADAYLAFVKLCIESVKPGGFLCVVLPQAFLLARNASQLRKALRAEFDIRCIVDLTAVPVFGKVGAYSVLIVAQRLTKGSLPSQSAQLVKIQEFVGPALQACLDKRIVDTPYYTVFEVPQSYFDTEEWVLMGPKDVSLRTALNRHKPISHYLEVKQGFVTGADSVFILDRKFVPKNELAIFADYLPDKLMEKYKLPTRLNNVVFYPFEEQRMLSIDEVEERYPWTWDYLNNHRKALTERKSVQSGRAPWWRPVWPRDPSNMLRQKIVCPHLMLTPRFGLDVKGTITVSHSPFLITRDELDDQLLKFFCAVLNSAICHWFIQTHSPKYSRGYNRVEVSLIKSIPVPNPQEVDNFALRELLTLVDTALKNGSNSETDLKIDHIIAGMYGLSKIESDIILGTAEW